MLDPIFLSRVQFAFHISFHYIYPPLTIGLSLFLILLEGMFLITKKTIYQTLTRFWVKIFGLIFALGVATGIVNVFGFGTNWAQFSHYVGDVFGALLGAEGVFAFTMEAGFLGILLFGWDRVSPKMHFFATCMVAFGAHFSATWIVFANSWMQTPQGYQIVGQGIDQHCVLTSFWEAVFNPSALTRLGHVLLGCWLTGAFLILSVASYYILKKKYLRYGMALFPLGLLIGGICIFLQLWSGDSSGRVVSTYQPAKLAALEGLYETQERAPMYLIGWSNSETKKVTGIKIPGLLSLLVNRNLNQKVIGLDQVPREDWPAVTPLFQTYRWMIYMWGWMFMMLIWATVQYFRKKIETSVWLLRSLAFSILAPMSANIVGWFSAEIGRQPWIVYGLMRTKDGISSSLKGGQVLGSLIMFIFVFTLLFILFIFLLDQKIKHGPEDKEFDVDPYQDPYKKMEDQHIRFSKGGN
jgi:cytochrome d ubiquinol oxidase subunit I